KRYCSRADAIQRAGAAVQHQPASVSWNADGGSVLPRLPLLRSSSASARRSKSGDRSAAAALVLDFTITAAYFVTAIGAPFQKYDDILRHREHKDTEKNTLHVARSTRRRRAAGEACQPQTNDHWTVARSFVCGRRASRRGLPCRPPASSAFSVSLCLSSLSKSIRQRNYEMLY